jgi:signal transduction histidine kinase
MFEFMQSILLMFIEIMCCKIFYETFGKTRYKGWMNVMQTVLLLGSICFFAYLFSGHFVIRQIAIIWMVSIFMIWHVEISLKKSFVLAILYEAVLLAMDYLAYWVIGCLSLGKNLSNKQYETCSVLVYLLGKVVLFFFILVIRKIFGKKSMETTLDTEWLRFLFFPVFTIAVISAMLSVFEYVQTAEQANLLLVIAFGMVGMNILVFYLIRDVVKREAQMHENQIFQIRAKNQLEMYRSISENFDNQRRKTHEYKNQISCIESLLEKKQYSRLEEYVKKISGSLNSGPDAINTNHVIVNAVLNTKYREADENGIVFVLRVNDLSQLWMDDEDIVTILSNLLDNAVEACQKCDIGKRIIKLKLVNEDGMIKIGVRNTFQNPILYENGEIKSTKKIRTEEHGIGIKNIIEAVEKYNGSYVIKNDGEEFYFSIVIPA